MESDQTRWKVVLEATCHKTVDLLNMLCSNDKKLAVFLLDSTGHIHMTHINSSDVINVKVLYIDSFNDFWV